ncbi:MAG: DUF86 domain-containing protein [Methanophagales archaeon]|nr:DUF86 domain-containing protein [Methanophagales archaeon]
MYEHNDTYRNKGDKLIHGYFGVNLKRVWKTVKEEIPPLKPLFEKILRNLEK